MSGNFLSRTVPRRNARKRSLIVNNSPTVFLVCGENRVPPRDFPVPPMNFTGHSAHFLRAPVFRRIISRPPVSRHLWCAKLTASASLTYINVCGRSGPASAYPPAWCCTWAVWRGDAVARRTGMQRGSPCRSRRARGWVKNRTRGASPPGSHSTEPKRMATCLQKNCSRPSAPVPVQAGSGGDQARMRAFPVAAAALVWQGAKGIR